MHHAVFATTLLALLGTIAVAAAGAQELKPGKWQITTEGVMDMGGQKTPMPKNQMESCVTPEQAKKAAEEAAMPKMEGCKTEVLSRNPPQMKIRATCDTAVITSTVTSAGDTYSAVTHMEMDHGGAKMVTDVTTIGKYVGPCTQ